MKKMTEEMKKEEMKKGWIPLLTAMILIIVAMSISQLARIDWLLLESLKTIVVGLSDILLFIIPFILTALIVRNPSVWGTQRGWLVVNVILNLALIAVSPWLPKVQLGIAFNILFSTVAIPIIGFVLVYAALAPNNCYFTFVQEGTVKFVVKGDAFYKCLIQWKDHTLDREWNVIEGEEWHFFGGLRSYGGWPVCDIHVYEFRWVGVTEEGKEQPKEEWIDSMIVKDDVYLCKVPGAEDADKLPLDFQILLTISIVNPYKAKFTVQRWLETVLNRIQPVLREYIARYKFDKLLKAKSKIGGQMWEKLKESGLLGDDGEFCKRYGVDIRAIEVRKIDPPEEYRRETLKEFVAKQEKKATIVKAEAEEKRLEKVYSAVKKFGKLGKLIRTLEAVEKSTLAASLTIQAVPGLPEVLRGIFGRPVEQITAEELKELKETIRKLSEKKKKEKKSTK